MYKETLHVLNFTLCCFDLTVLHIINSHGINNNNNIIYWLVVQSGEHKAGHCTPSWPPLITIGMLSLWSINDYWLLYPLLATPVGHYWHAITVGRGWPNTSTWNIRFSTSSHNVCSDNWKGRSYISCMPVLANIHSIGLLAYDVPDTEDEGLPTKFRFNVGPALQLIAGSMPVNRIQRWPNTNLSPGMLYTLRKHVAFNRYCFNVDPRSSTLEIAFGDCTVFSDFCIILVTFKIPAPETPHTTIHWRNADVMLGHRLRRWANIIPTKPL